VNSSERDTTTHLEEVLAEFVLGRLAPDDHARWLAHVATCEPCRSLVATAQRVREDDAHLATEVIVELADRAIELSHEQALHVETCAACAAELEQMRAIAAPEELQSQISFARRTPAPRARVRRVQRIAWPMGMLAVAAVLVMMLLPRGAEELLLSDLSDLEPLPVRITRSVTEPESMEEARLLGLEAYRAGDWVTATEHLERAIARGSELDLRLYLASSRLFLGDDVTAANVIDTLLFDPNVTPGLRDEARWLRVQIALRAEDVDTTNALLEAIISDAGRRAAEAQELQERVRRSRLH
jgi:hypothetical protein